MRPHFESESADQTPAEPQQVESPAPTPEPTAAAVPTEPPAPPSISPTPSPDPVPAPTDTPSPTPLPSRPPPCTCTFRRLAAEDATPTAAAPAEPTAKDLMAERLRQFVQEGIREEFPEAEDQPVHVFPLGLSDAAGEFWGAVTDGPQPFKITADDEAVNFWHFAAAYQLSEENEWIEVDRLEIELAPQRTQVDLTPTGGCCSTARRWRGSRSAAAPARTAERSTSSGSMVRRSARSSHG